MVVKEKKPNNIFKKCENERPWFGLEQEYTLFNLDGKTPYGC